jgi:hypothetical protein
LLPLLSQCLSLEEEISRRSLKFIQDCVCNRSRLVSAIANYGIYHGRYNSFIGHNALFCSRKYKVNIREMCNGEVNARCIVNRYVNNQIDERQVRTVCFLRELISLRDNMLVFSNNFGFSREELNVVITDICTS